MKLLFWKEPPSKRKQIKRILVELAWYGNGSLIEMIRLANMDLTVLSDDEVDKIHTSLILLQSAAHTVYDPRKIFSRIKKIS